MQSASSPIPSICISPASPNKNHASPCPDDDPQVDDEAFRAKYLSPPPSVSPRHLSPLLSSTRANVAPKGLQREQFDLLLKASRERRAVLGVHRAPDLRKELAVKNQKNKQLERRARFLSKLSEPPSPTATATPKTPPESPAILHCFLPSPGLDSPLAVFESVAKDACDAPAGQACQGWVEQIDFRLTMLGKQSDETPNARSRPRRTARKLPPSLDEISARMGGAALAQRQNSVPPRPKLDVGRLRVPGVSVSNGCEWENVPPSTPKLEVTTTIVPHTTRTTPFPLNESNLRALNRLHTARGMIKTLQRRSSPPPPGWRGSSRTTSVQQKRKSAPAALYGGGRAGFEHKVLSIPGGF